MSNPQRCDVIVAGAGFAGLCLLHRLRRDIQLNTRVTAMVFDLTFTSARLI